MIAALAALGVFVAVPLTGRLALGPLGLPIPKIAWPSLWVAAGIAIWTAPLLLSLILGVYKPELLGVAGWLVAGAILWRAPRPSVRHIRLPKWDVIALAGILLAGVIAAAFPDDPFAAHGDIAEYANTAVYIANHGQLGVPYPWNLGIGSPDPLFGPLGHLYLTSPTISFGFGHVFPLWLAQTWATAGFDGLIRMNIVLSVFALLAVYGLMKRLTGDRIGAIGILLLAFNPAQIWIVQQTLSEPLTQLLIWAALILVATYLSRGGSRLAVLAGTLFGAAAFVRIDALLLIPCLVGGHAMWLLATGGLRDRSWRPIYLGAIPVFAAAFAYFVLFSRPYLLTLGSQVLAIGALTIAAALLLIACRSQLVHSRLLPRLQRGLLLPAVFVVLFGVAFYAYFVRPAVPPFDTYADPLQGGVVIRTRIEDAIQNLGRYLTPGIVWGGFIGWGIAFASAVRGSRINWIMPVLIVGLGFTAVYGWNQSSVPYHFVAIRRFVPVVLPGLMLLCGLAASIGLRRLSRVGRRLALSLTTALLVLFTLWIGVATYAVAQRQGVYGALSGFSSSIPRGEQIVALGDPIDSGSWWLPMYLTFDTPVTPLDITTPDGLMTAVDRLRNASSADPATIVFAAGLPLAPITGELIDHVAGTQQVIDNYAVPVPRTSSLQDFQLNAVRATGLETIGAELAARPQWMVLLSGWYQERAVEDGWVRGTDGSGTVVVPIEGAQVPDTLGIAISNSGPAGGPLKVSVNGATLFNGTIPAGTWTQDLRIPTNAGLELGQMATVEIDSNTFAPDPDLGYPGPVGVEVQSLKLERSPS